MIIPQHITKKDNAHIITGPAAPLNSILKKFNSIGPLVIFKMRTLHSDASAASGMKRDAAGCFSNIEYIQGAFPSNSVAIKIKNIPQNNKDPIKHDHMTIFLLTRYS